MSEPLFMTAEELAGEADCAVDRVEALAREGLIPGLKWGRSWIFPRHGIVSDLAALARRDAVARAARARRARERFASWRAAKDARRRAAKLLRTAAWADRAAMRAVYAEAQRRSRETGIPHHVDHEIPLQGELVSGLHVHNNLQILTGSENIRKLNRFEITP